MTTANHPQNQQPQGGATDLGQISTDHASEEYRQANPDDFRTRAGRTTEGHYFVLHFEYAPGAPGNAEPIRITGWYDANDGIGEVDVTIWHDLPAVITESTEF
jgi:hypothetical protein